MLTERKRKRVKRGLILAGLCLLLYYVGVYRPLSRHSQALDAPLRDYWSQLAEVTCPTNGFEGKDLPRIEEALRQAHAGISALAAAERESRALIELDPAVRAKLIQPFQNSDFQNERQLLLEEVVRLAGQQKVTLGPGVAAGFPEYTADRKQPALLWAQLAFLRHLLTSALQCKVGTITEVRLPDVAFRDSGTNNPAGRLAEVPLRIQLSGPAGAVTQFLQSLPLRAAEIQSRGLPPAATNKPALFIDQVFFRKEGRNPTDEVRLDLRVSGFVYHLPPLAASFEEPYYE